MQIFPKIVVVTEGEICNNFKHSFIVLFILIIHLMFFVINGMKLICS